MPRVGCPKCGNPTTVLGSSLSVTCWACGTAFSLDPEPEWALSQADGDPGPMPSALPYPAGPQPMLPPLLPPDARRRIPVWAIVLMIVGPIALIGGLAVWGYHSYLAVPDHDDWYRHHSEDGLYAALFPREPFESHERKHFDAGSTTIYVTVRPVPNGHFGVWCFDVPRKAEFKLEDGLRAAADEAGLAMGATRVTTHQGLRALVGDVDGGPQPRRLMILLAVRRVYVIEIEGNLEHWDFFVENFRIDREVLDGSFEQKRTAPPPPKARKPRKQEPERVGPFKMSQDQNKQVYDGELIRVGFGATGGRAPYSWSLRGMPEQWKYETRDRLGDSERLPSTSCIIEGRSPPGTYTVWATVDDAEGNTEGGKIEIEVRELPEEMIKLGLNVGPHLIHGHPTVSGDTVTTYPGIQTKFTVGVTCTLGRFPGAEFDLDEEFLPPEGSATTTYGSLELNGCWQESGEFKFTVSANARVPGIDKTFAVSKEFTLLVVAPPEELWPSRVYFTRGSEAAVVGVEVQGSPTWIGVYWSSDLPLKSNDWPATVEWSWDEAQVPPGMTLVVDDRQCHLAGTPTEAGEYAIQLTASIMFKWTTRTVDHSDTLKLRVNAR
jgi:hypothetical protein